ncbi:MULTISPECIES: 4Fe-4S dicluster domain-containing protein [Romboutsia]|uniref:4Fe-4S ferredoxin-type iron-sulfur binding domain profile n=1 Tax=Romboutsia hominis TaxID=1507512 RepID=A0A2P2BRP7_9FIRM|nr:MULTISPECIES: 4Fe-4S binding protein [Romboutsia]MCH1960314.1 4Fe-4S binding protein [Romboutsia hominis]MCH1969252.1 4Fe-4S binding protein [Romboutsia hominis]MDB8794480.1 4Fe-4S binding protein [Romboutsia sp. 1001216sp1]MDB8797488.1 4Fe-4S binding protein [Romboutsia sp. 1001216sp1]MDB8797743.1 4Fe-4S binding protein [Romboutsia sp. 1001216sp1]
MPGKKLVLNEKWCKSCGICVEFCPKDVLKLENSKVQIQKEKDCIFCGLCELRCPDYAIYIAQTSED